jgi:mycothiol synthase
MHVGPPTDDSDVESLFAAIQDADGMEALTEYKMMHRGHEGATTAVVGTVDGATVAYAQLALHPGDGLDLAAHWAIEIAVDPTRRTRATYGAMIAAAAALVPTGDRYVVWAWHEDLEAVLERAGYVPTRILHRLECPLPVEATAVEPPGVAIRSFEVGRDEAAWLTVNNAAFAGHPENGALTKTDLGERLAMPWFDPANLLMAWDGSDLLGSCWTKHHADGVGEIYIVGVSPHAQGRGLGRDLVIRGLEHLYRTGATRGMLYVDGSNEAAMWLYRELGFRPVWTNRQYELLEA